MNNKIKVEKEFLFLFPSNPVSSLSLFIVFPPDSKKAYKVWMSKNKGYINHLSFLFQVNADYL